MEGTTSAQGPCRDPGLWGMGWGAWLPIQGHVRPGMGLASRDRAGHTPSWGSDLGTNSLCYSSVTR